MMAEIIMIYDHVMYTSLGSWKLVNNGTWKLFDEWSSPFPFFLEDWRKFPINIRGFIQSQ